MALLTLAIARAGSEGLSRPDLERLPTTEALYSGGVQARYVALLRDLEMLTGQSLRNLRRSGTDAPASPAERLWDEVEPPVVYDATDGRYRLRAPVAGPLRLPEESLRALTLVARALRGGAALPGGRDLLQRLTAALGEGERSVLETALAGGSPAFTLELGVREQAGGLDLVASRLWHAQRQRQTVKFSYRAREGVSEHYGDEVLDLWLADHAYVSVWCEEANKTIVLRLDRIVPESLALAPAVARGRQHRGIAVKYRLDGEVARGEVTQRLDEQSVEWEADGAAVVSGRARSLFWAQQIVLRYGAHARALEPPALVAVLQRTAERMRELYAEG